MQAVHSQLRQGVRMVAIGVLTQVLSDEQVLVTKLRNYHWNVVGPSFRAAIVFEEQYGILALRIDDIAERLRALGLMRPEPWPNIFSTQRFVNTRASLPQRMR